MYQLFGVGHCIGAVGIKFQISLEIIPLDAAFSLTWCRTAVTVSDDIRCGMRVQSIVMHDAHSRQHVQQECT